MSAPESKSTTPKSVTVEVNSAFLKHLLNYPIVKDSVDTVTSSPYAKNAYVKKSIALGDSAYKTFAAPVLPYVAKPYQYVEPYVKKADSIADQTLAKVDNRFPVIKKPTGELYSSARDAFLYPYVKATEGRDHVLNTYNTERKKLNAEGLVAYTKAVVGTAFVIGTEGYVLAQSYLKNNPTTEEAAPFLPNGTAPKN